MTDLASSLVASSAAPHMYWITSRAAGVVALVLSSISVSVGLTMGGRMVKGRGADLRAAHETLSLAALVALAVHGLSLLGDGFLRPSLGDVAVPFLFGYKTFWTSTGIIAFWAMAALGLSYYARARIGTQRWRKLHRYTAIAWVLGIVHSLGEGTDAGQLWFLALTGIVVVPALTLLIGRHVTTRARTAFGGPGSARLGGRTSPRATRRSAAAAPPARRGARASAASAASSAGTS